MTKSIENLVADFLLEAVRDASADDAIFDSEVHDTVYQTIKTDRGIRISDCESDLVPNEGSTALKEVDGFLILVCFVRVAGMDKSDRMKARDDCRELTKAFCKLFFDSTDMGGRVCDTMIGRAVFAYESIKADVYAVANVPLIVNQTGHYDFEKRVF